LASRRLNPEERISRAVLGVVADRPEEAFALRGEKTALSDLSAGPMSRAAIEMVGGGFLALAQAVGAAERLWMTWDLDVNRPAGTLTIRDVNVASNEERSETIDVADVLRLRVERSGDFWSERGRSSLGVEHPFGVEALIWTRRSAQGSPPRSLRLFIHGVDTREKVADVGYRLGSLMGLGYQRVLRSDPMRLQIEMQREGGAGWSAAPRIEAAADYPRGRIAPEASAAAATWTLVGRDPAAFPGETRIQEWSPGREVRLGKPFDPWAIGCLPIALAFLAAGPIAWFLIQDKVQELGVQSAIGILSVVTVLGLLFGGLGMVYVFSGLPRRVSILWGERLLRVKTPLRSRRVPFDRVAGLDLEWLKYDSGGPQGGTGPHTIEFQCSIKALLGEADGAKSDSVELLSTSLFKRDPDAPYDVALPLAKELADALNVPLRVVPGGSTRKS
jgi:hypothetical protein